MSRLPLSVLGALLVVLPVRAQDSAHLHRPHELRLSAQRPHASPQRDVLLRVQCLAPDGHLRTATGFWDGDSIWRVRVRPDAVGRWTWTTLCSDTLDAGLHGRTGSFVVTAPEDTSTLVRHGPLRVSSTGRHLEHEDGTPFFYLADTVWEIGWKSTTDEIRAWLEDRTRKRFSAVHMTLLSHQKMNDYGVYNRYRQDSFLYLDLLRPNPAYFLHLDSLVAEANNRGMLVGIAPLWAEYTRLYGDPARVRVFSDEEAETWLRYAAARYGAYHVLWILAGDNLYDTPERRAYWSRMARVLRDHGGDNLLTVHPAGSHASYEDFGGATEWIDMHMMQSGHSGSGTEPWDLARRGWDQVPVKPLLDGEPSFEDIKNMFWVSDPSVQYRLTPFHIRRSRYLGLLSGALVGTTYGANGVWQWHVPAIEYSTHEPRDYVGEAIHYPGSAQMTLLRDFCLSHGWPFWTPCPERLLASSLSDRIAISSRGDSLIGYVPARLASLRLAGTGAVRVEWTDPATGIRLADTVLNAQDGAFTLLSPDREDALFTLLPLSTDVEAVDRNSRPTAQVWRSGTDCHLAITLPEPQTLPIHAFDILGRCVYSQTHALRMGTSILIVPLPPTAFGILVDFHEGRMMLRIR